MRSLIDAGFGFDGASFGFGGACCFARALAPEQPIARELNSGRRRSRSQVRVRVLYSSTMVDGRGARPGNCAAVTAAARSAVHQHACEPLPASPPRRLACPCLPRRSPTASSCRCHGRRATDASVDASGREAAHRRRRDEAARRKHIHIPEAGSGCAGGGQDLQTSCEQFDGLRSKFGHYFPLLIKLVVSLLELLSLMTTSCLL